MDKRCYIAYGSNLNKAQMQERCKGARVIGTAVIRDYRLSFRKSETGFYATIDKCPGASVPVAVWETTPDDEKSLDGYEGLDNPLCYRKKEMQLRTVCTDGTEKDITGYVYILPETKPEGRPKNYYISKIRRGYRDFGLDEAVLDEAIERCP